MGGGEHVVGRRAQRGAGQHHGWPGRHGRRPRHRRRARARRRHGVPAAGRRPDAAPRRRPPPRRPHHRRPPQGLPARICCNCNRHDGGVSTDPHEIAGPRSLEDRSCTHGQLHWRSGELRRHLGSSGPHAIRPRRRRRSGQPHLGALLHGALLTGVKHPSRAQDGAAEGRRARRGRWPAVGAERRGGDRAVVHHLQGRVGHGGAAGPPGRHAAVRHGAGGLPGHGVPGPARQARAGRRVPGAHPHAALLRRRRCQRQRRGRRHPGAQHLRLRARAGVRPPRRRARGRQGHGAQEEAAAHRLQRQHRRAHHRGSHGYGQRLDLARRARYPRRRLRDLHCHVSWHRIWHVRAQKNLRLNST